MNVGQFFLLAVAWVVASTLSSAASLTFVRAIPLHGVHGRIDHLALDPATDRLFVAAMENGTIEVVDLKKEIIVHSVRGLSAPKDILHLPGSKQLVVANSGDNTVRVYQDSDYKEQTRLQLDGDPDNLRYDETNKLTYVGYGKGSIGIVDLEKNALVGAIPVGGHPEAFELQQKGPLMFVNVPDLKKVAVLDRKEGKLLLTLSLGFAASNYPMALDEENHRLFVGCRLPARLIVFDTSSGVEVAKLPLRGDCDDLIYDAARRQLYASCGEGFIDVYSIERHSMKLKDSVKSVSKARTCFFDGKQLFLAVPGRSGADAEIRRYKVND